MNTTPLPLRPLLLVADREVKLIWGATCSAFTSIAQTTASKLRPSHDFVFEITVNGEAIRHAVSHSWLKDRVNPEEVVAAAVIHEVAHIRYGTFDTSVGTCPGLNYGLGMVDNMIEDVRVEYHLAREFPAYADFLRLLAMVLLKKARCAPSVDADGKFLRRGRLGLPLMMPEGKDLPVPEARMRKVNQLMDKFWNLSRFGVFTGEVGDFESFLLPLLLSARRGKRANAILVSQLVWAYIMEAANAEAEAEKKEDGGKEERDGNAGKGEGSKRDKRAAKEQKQGGEDGKNQNSEGEGEAEDGEDGESKGEGVPGKIAAKPEETLLTDVDIVPVWEPIKPMTQEAIEEILANSSGEAMDAGVLSAVNDLLATSGESMPCGVLGGPGSGRPFQYEENDNSFWRATVEKHGETINALRDVFSRYFEASLRVGWYEGDLNIRRQQDAYLHSLTGDTAKDYEQTRRQDPELDLLILRDTSGSIAGVMGPYAEAIVCTLEALEGLGKVRTSVIDFGDSGAVVKDFDEPLRQARIVPAALGGTNLQAGMLCAGVARWQAEKRLMVVLTDGSFNDYQVGWESLAAYSKVHKVTVSTVHIGALGGLFSTMMEYACKVGLGLEVVPSVDDLPNHFLGMLTAAR